MSDLDAPSGEPGKQTEYLRVGTERLQARLDHVVDKLAKTQHEHDIFLTKLSHEMHNSHAVILGMASLLQHRHRTMDPGSADHAFDALERQANLTAELFDQLMTLAVANDEDTGDVALGREVEAAIASMALDFPVRVVCDPALRVRMDPRNIMLIVRNLVDNAAIHGAPPLTIEANNRGEMTELRVTDHGHGVRIEFVRSLFEPFCRDDRRPKRPGAGLGLSIVKQIVERDGGDIHFEPSEDSGASFVVRLPRVDDA